MVAGLFPANYPSSEHTRDLGADDRDVIVFDRKRISLIYEAGPIARSRDLSAVNVFDGRNRTFDGRTVDMHIDRR